jgi:hypothetical protein
MKPQICCALAMMSLSIASGAAEETSHKVVIKKLVPQIQQTPRIQASGVKDKPFDPRYWMEIEAELEVETTDPSGFIPELTTSWFAIVKDDRTGKPIALTGKVVFRDVRTKNKRAHVIAFIGPDTLEKLTGKDRPSEGDVEAVALTLSGPGILNDEKHAAGLQKATAKEESKWWSSGKYQTMDGLIVAKSKTPFASLWSDRYPFEKPE